ncbi:hypothetical protein ACJRO7_002168 [Eucalyptus globulus]|uniref:Uncharacterized protein n=1 Tax=Eucalyptus globulus TaxID=34317 RepID=A0ABD3LX30_EUCGL
MRSHTDRRRRRRPGRTWEAAAAEIEEEETRGPRSLTPDAPRRGDGRTDGRRRCRVRGSPPLPLALVLPLLLGGEAKVRDSCELNFNRAAGAAVEERRWRRTKKLTGAFPPPPLHVFLLPVLRS